MLINNEDVHELFGIEAEQLSNEALDQTEGKNKLRSWGQERS